MNVPTEAAKYDESLQFVLRFVSHMEVLEDSQTRDAVLLHFQMEVGSRDLSSFEPLNT